MFHLLVVCTIGTVELELRLADRLLKEWRSSAIRNLLELENLAKSLRDQLEKNEVRLDQMEDRSRDLNLHAMTFTTLVDRSSGIAGLGIW